MKAVIFDLDGTLVDTTKLILSTYVETLRSLGRADVSTDNILSHFNIGPTPVVLEHFLGRPILPQDLELYFAAYEVAISKLQALPQIVDMLIQLHQMGYQLGLFTSATRRAVSIILPRIGLDRYFEAIVAGDEVERSKPAPDGLELVCLRLGVKTEEAVYVGDAEVDLVCARSARVLGIQAAWSKASVIPAGDHLVAHQPNEIIALIDGTKYVYH